MTDIKLLRDILEEMSGQKQPYEMDTTEVY